MMDQGSPSPNLMLQVPAGSLQSGGRTICSGIDTRCMGACSTSTPIIPLMIAGSSPAPFVTKIYDIVDDPLNDPIVSWGQSFNSFVVWDFYEFSRSILPRSFKHNNFSSFVRQLNTYGFRKVDPDRWEFAHEEFMRGQKHRLNNIHRRRSGCGMSNCNSGLGASGQTSQGNCNAGWSKYGQVKELRREKNSMMLELGRLSRQHNVAQEEVMVMSHRLEIVESRQEEMMAFFARALMGSPPPTPLPTARALMGSPPPTPLPTTKKQKKTTKRPSLLTPQSLNHGPIGMCNLVGSKKQNELMYYGDFRKRQKVVESVDHQIILPECWGESSSDFSAFRPTPYPDSHHRVTTEDCAHSASASSSSFSEMEHSDDSSALNFENLPPMMIRGIGASHDNPHKKTANPGFEDLPHDLDHHYEINAGRGSIKVEELICIEQSRSNNMVGASKRIDLNHPSLGMSDHHEFPMLSAGGSTGLDKFVPVPIPVPVPCVETSTMPSLEELDSNENGAFWENLLGANTNIQRDIQHEKGSLMLP